MRARFLTVLLASVIVLTFCFSCGSDEGEARNMLLQSQKMLRDGNWVELKKHLKRIISEYPETKAAEAAAEMLDELMSRVNHIAETSLKAALVASVGYLASYPDAELSMAKLRKFGYREMEGVEIEIVRSQPDDFLIESEHVAGDRVYYVGNDGRIEYEKYEEK